MKLNLPPGDAWDLPTSDKRFSDGAHYRIEMATVNDVEAWRAVLEASRDELDFTINRIDVTAGIIRYTDKEIEQFIELAKEMKIELMMAIGVRAPYDIGAQVKMQTLWAHKVGYRLRGMEQMVRGIEDAKRALEMGCRGIIIHDEGLLYILNEMRKDEVIPKDTKFKASAGLGYANPVGLLMMERMGADSVNPQRDLTLPMIAAFRQVIHVPIDVHVDNPPATGGFIRTYEAPEMVRIASPTYMKTGNLMVPEHGMSPGSVGQKGRRMAMQASIVAHTIRKYQPELTQTTGFASDMAIPK